MLVGCEERVQCGIVVSVSPVRDVPPRQPRFDRIELQGLRAFEGGFRDGSLPLHPLIELEPHAGLSQGSPALCEVLVSLDRRLEFRGGRIGIRDRLLADTPLSSVKGRIIIGIGLVTLLLVGVIGAATWQAQVHQSALTDLEEHSHTASLLQTAEANAAVTGLLLQRYVISGDEIYVRARVVSSTIKANPYQEGDHEMAWTQPVVR